MRLELLPAHSGEWEQGFVDQWGVFMDRKEALEVAIQSGQLNMKYKCGNQFILFSEDLY